jgi:HNH endonuclease
VNQEIKSILESSYKIVGDCKEWQGNIAKGYGILYHKSLSYYVHRIAYEIYVGAIPKGMVICHKCNNKKCYNIDHLYVGSHKDNGVDRSNAKKMGFKPNNEGIVRIPEDLHRRAKLEVYRKGLSLQDWLRVLIETGLAEPVDASDSSHTATDEFCKAVRARSS